MLWGWKKLLWERNNSNGFWYLGPFVSMFCSAWWKMSLLGIIRHWSLPRHQYGGCYVNNVNIVNIIQRNNCFPGEIEEWGVRSEYWRLKMVGMVELWLAQVNVREVFNSNLLLLQAVHISLDTIGLILWCICPFSTFTYGCCRHKDKFR